jgi:hypothetical protein
VRCRACEALSPSAIGDLSNKLSRYDIRQILFLNDDGEQCVMAAGNG